MPKRELIRRCESLRKHILSREWADEHEIAEVWPKQSDRARAWEDCFGHLRYIQGRAESSLQVGVNADAEMLKALNDEPQSLLLTNLLQVSVYPKCFNALLWFHHKDFAVAVLADREDAIREMLTKNLPEKHEIDGIWSLLDRIEEEIARQQCIIAYAATRPGLNVDRDEVNDPPQDWLDLHPMDFIRIHQAFWEVNVKRIGFIPYLVTPKRVEGKEGAPKRMSWSVFGAEMANIFKTDVAEILNNRSLVSLLGQVRLGGDVLQGGF